MKLLEKSSFLLNIVASTPRMLLHKIEFRLEAFSELFYWKTKMKI